MEAERSDGGEAEVVDEFACAGMLRGSLTSLHGAVERVFGVAFDIGERKVAPASDGQIWLKLQGREKGVRAAKVSLRGGRRPGGAVVDRRMNAPTPTVLQLFVKGVVNQEEQQEVSYPAVLHCVFCGARGLFLDSLIRSTSAQIIVGSVGYLLVSGLAEPVVRAYSLITDLVERYEGTQSRGGDPAGRGSSESLDSRRAFKTLVERWEDRHVLDLLVLPGAVKEVLLDLVRESGLGTNPGPPGKGSDRYVDVKWDSTTCRWDQGTAGGPDGEPAPTEEPGAAESTRDRLLPQDPGERDQPEQRAPVDPPLTEEPRQQDEQELQFLLLLKFFTAMGYTEEVVRRVLVRTGPKEASQILDLVQQEQDRNDQEEQAGGQLGSPGQRERNRPCESEHRDPQEPPAGGQSLELTNGEMRGGADGSTPTEPPKEAPGPRRQEEDHEEDFVLGVLKKAAVSCGYAEQKVAEVYSTLPHRSTHHLLLELQREEKKDSPDAMWEGPREIDDVVLEKAAPSSEGGRGEAEAPGPSGGPAWLPAPRKQPGLAAVFDWSGPAHQFPLSQYAPQSSLPEVKGPPTSRYPSALEPCKQPGQPGTLNTPPPASDSGKQALQAPAAWAAAPGAQERRGAASVVVTGEQRFLEGLQTPFQLQLTVEPGDPRLRTVIIDGSNVAMR
ncbi:unnamed protein product [Tetraodon nigroviridis]|uniref:(spotted green pufferfish) hypothetical protein n=1 Tax=Tetraodon nigroviridis TaxID=99883 RepID=Q4T7J6_TETNG|nr:unnamed protein product [Tetraodon nigroviridis]